MEPRQTRPRDPLSDDFLDGSGWEDYRDEGAPPPRAAIDLRALFVMLDGLRRVVPRELEERFNALVRELLLTLRSLIDWYLDRLDRPRREPEVEEIKID